MKKYLAFLLVLILTICCFVFPTSAAVINFYSYPYNYEGFRSGPPAKGWLKEDTNVSLIFDPYFALLGAGMYGQPVPSGMKPVSVTSVREFGNTSHLLGTEEPGWWDEFNMDYQQDGIIADPNFILPDKSTWLNSFYTGIFSYAIPSMPTSGQEKWLYLSTYTRNDESSLGYEANTLDSWFICMMGEQIGFEYSIMIRTDNLSKSVYINAEDFSFDVSMFPYGGSIARENYASLPCETRVTVDDTVYRDNQARTWTRVNFSANFTFDYSNPLFSNGIPIGVNNYRFDSFVIRWNLDTSIVLSESTLIQIGSGFFKSQKYDLSGVVIPPNSSLSQIDKMNDVLDQLHSMVGFDDSLILSRDWFTHTWNFYKSSALAFSGFVNYMFDQMPILANLVYCLIFIGVFWILLGSFSHLNASREISNRVRRNNRNKRKKGG